MQLLRMFHTFRRPTDWQIRENHALRLLSGSLALALLLPLAACAQDNSDSRSSRRAIAQSQAIASDMLQTELALSPETASRLGMERRLGPATSFALDNHSQAGFERRRLVRIELLQRVRMRPPLPDGHPLIEDLYVAERALLDLISLEQLGYGRYNYRTFRPYAIDPFSGKWIEGPNLLAFRQSINTVDQATAFIARLQSLSEALQDTRRRVIADQIAGIRIPTPLLAETEALLRTIANPEGGALAEISASFNALSLDVPGLEPADRDAMGALVRQEIEINLRPAYLKLAETLSIAADDTVERLGIWAQPQGEDLFTGILRASTGETISIERLLERQIESAAAWRNRLEDLLVLPPLEDGSEVEAPETLAEKLIWFEAQLNAEAPAAAEEANAEVAEASLLSQLSPKTLAVTLELDADYRAGKQAASELDLFWLSEPYSAWGTDIENNRHPLRTLIEYATISEAWRAYIWTAQTEGSPADTRDVDRAGQIWISLIQASLAAADTGLHLVRWTLQDTKAYLMSEAGLAPELSEILVLRIAARPGYYSAQAVAVQRFTALSERARAVLGTQYSELEFQRTLIENGPRPLGLIERDIETWYGDRLAN